MIVAVDVTVVDYRDVDHSVECYIVTTVTGKMCCFHLHFRLIGNHIPERILKMNFKNPPSPGPKCFLPVPATAVWSG